MGSIFGRSKNAINSFGYGVNKIIYRTALVYLLADLTKKTLKTITTVFVYSTYNIKVSNMAYTGYLSDIFKSVKMQFNAGRCATT